MNFQVCVSKNDLIQHLRNHLMDDNKMYIINNNPGAADGQTVTVPTLVDLLKLDNKDIKELCA